MPISKEDLQAIAKCCLNGAGMLELADEGDLSPDKRARVRKANQGQAALLRQAADMATRAASEMESA